MSDKKTFTEHESTSNDHEDLSPLAKRFLWADSSSAVERVIFWLGVVCVVLFVLDFVIHRHSYAPGEGMPGYYAIVGFVAFTLIVLGASQLRKLILRNETYYSPNSIDSEPYPENALQRLTHGAELDSSDYAELEEGEGQASNIDAKSNMQNSPNQGDSS